MELFEFSVEEDLLEISKYFVHHEDIAGKVCLLTAGDLFYVKSLFTVENLQVNWERFCLNYEVMFFSS